MNITQVQVSIHEKRNHPYEYGHYDCGVTLTADLDPGQDYGAAVDVLRLQARAHVLAECNEWERDVREQKRIDDLRISIHGRLRSVRYAGTLEGVNRYADSCLEQIAQLPQDMRGQFKADLAVAMQEAQAQIIKEDDVPDPDDDPDDDLDDDFDHDLCPHCHRVLDLETGLCPNCDP